MICAVLAGKLQHSRSRKLKLVGTYRLKMTLFRGQVSEVISVCQTAIIDFRSK
jgi:hypothetical protein